MSESMGGIIPECPGDFVGIRMGERPRQHWRGATENKSFVFECAEEGSDKNVCEFLHD
jgi:hypothetical protein